MAHELTPQIKAWLDTDPSSRDILAGADLLLRINRNLIVYNNIVRNPQAKAQLLEYELQKAYNLRVKQVTHEQVTEMMAKVEKIASTRNLAETGVSTRSDYQRGKRADHDSLPENIQACWVDNASILKRMRDCHTKLRLINSETSSCPDSDRYMWAKELLKLDKQYRENFNIYDHYKYGSDASVVDTASDARSDAKTALRLINLNKGKYAKSRNEELGARIVEWYNLIDNPSEKLTAELRELGLIE
jgi:hypothetical protein